jgi:FSR family fosmidomycin resistance protein-like MFS transporter
MFSLALLVPGRASLTLLILAALGSGAFHPAGTTEATLRGRLRFAGREATAASYFFLFGQMGLSIGPVLGGLLLDHVGVRGLLAFLPLGVGAGVWTWTRWSVAPCEKAGDVVHGQAGRRLRRGALGAFILLTALRSWSQANLVAFFPKYYSDLGFSPGMFGLVSGLLMGGSAAGNLLGGWLGDRTSQRGVILAAMVAAAVPLSALPLLGPTGWAYPVAFLCGFLTGMPHSILVVIAQGMLPRRMATASGLVLGFTFASGSFGTLLSGLQADLVGFDAMFLTTAAVALLAGALSLRLPERIEREVSPRVAP